VNGAILLVSALIPLVLAITGLLNGARVAMDRITPWAPLPALLTALIAPSLQVSMPSLLFGAEFDLDALGRVFLGLSAVLWLAAGHFSCGYFENRKSERRHRFFFLLTMSGNLGLTVAADAVTFYSFFALMTFSAYPLVIHDGTENSRRAGRSYLRLAILGEMLLLSGLLLATSQAGSTEFSALPKAIALAPNRNTIIALLLAGFGVKAGLVPLHAWLPLAHPAAPAPASAVLSGTMIKAGVLGWLRVLPLGDLESSTWSGILLASGIFMNLYGAICGFVQVRPKEALAYSSVSQMGYLTLAAGLALEPDGVAPAAIAACAAYTVHHGIAKAALFLGVGALSHADGPRVRVLLLTGSLYCGLSLAGFPLTTGAYAKWLLKSIPAGKTWNAWASPLLLVTSIATAFLVARIIMLLVRLQPDQVKHAYGFPLAMRLLPAWGSLVLLGVLGPWLLPIALRSAGLHVTSFSALEHIGGGAALVLWTTPLLYIGRRLWLRTAAQPAIPPGDLLTFVGSKLERLTPISKFLAVFTPWKKPFSRFTQIRTEGLIKAVVRMEEAQTRWDFGMIALALTWTTLWVFLHWRTG